MKIFNLPDLGEGLPDAEIHQWHVKVGDIVKVDDPLVSMETAKAVVDVPAPYAGKINKLHGQPGDIIKTGNPLVEFEQEKQDKSQTVVGAIVSGDDALNEKGSIQSKNSNSVKATPAVRALAKELNIELENVKPTGKNNLVTSQDVKDFAASHDIPENAIALKGVRRTMAKKMMESHAEIVPVTLIEDAVFDPLHDFSDLSIQVITSLIDAIKVEPNLNALFHGPSLSIEPKQDVNLGIAMDSQDGLFVPVIHKAQNLTAQELRDKLNEYKESVGSRTIDPKNLQSPSITLSNFGTIAGKYSNPIIVPPTVAIVGIGKMREIAHPYEGNIQICKMIPVSLTFDHRALTGGESARFIKAFIDRLTKN